MLLGVEPPGGEWKSADVEQKMYMLIYPYTLTNKASLLLKIYLQKDYIHRGNCKFWLKQKILFENKMKWNWFLIKLKVKVRETLKILAYFVFTDSWIKKLYLKEINSLNFDKITVCQILCLPNLFLWLALLARKVPNKDPCVYVDGARPPPLVLFVMPLPERRLDIQHIDIQHKDTHHKDTQLNDTEYNDTQQNYNQQNYNQHHDTQHNDTQHNDTQHNDTQHKGTQHNDTQNNNTQHNNTQHNNTQHNDTQHNNTQHNDILHSIA
jgi:hypothetical protein